MARAPARDKSVYFVGAGLSVAVGLPNTAELIDGVFRMAATRAKWKKRQLRAQTEEAFKFFYPDAENDGYRPDVVDFFSTLRTYIEIGSGLPGGFSEAALLQRSLKQAIAELIYGRLREAEPKLRAGHDFLDEMVRPGNVVISSNWDVLVELYAKIKGVPLRLEWIPQRQNELTLLKLHGSIDWCLGQNMKNYPARDYSTLRELLFSPYKYRMNIPNKDARRGLALRVRAMEEWSRAVQRSSSRATEPLMVTMAYGKVGELGPLEHIWKDAYAVLSRAKELKIVGYGMPPDDIEIRTLLRAAMERGSGRCKVHVLNPTPEVHERVRRFLDREVTSDFRGVPN